MLLEFRRQAPRWVSRNPTGRDREGRQPCAPRIQTGWQRTAMPEKNAAKIPLSFFRRW